LIEITVNLNNNLPEDIGAIAFQENETSLSFSINNASGYSNFIWYHNGNKRYETASSIIIAKENLEPGSNRLTIIATLTATGEVFSREIIFWINE